MSLRKSYRSSLRQHRPFALYWLSRVCSTVALQMQSVAVAWQMYDLTRNPLDLGLVGLTQFVPAALFVLVAGHVADRYDRRKIVRLCQLVAGLAGATLALGTAGGWLTRESLLAIVFVTGSARAFEQTTLTTLLPGIVPLSMLARATAAGASASQIAVIGGPAVGGLLYAVSPVLVYALCCTLYLVSSVLISLVAAARTATSREPLSLGNPFHINHNHNPSSPQYTIHTCAAYTVPYTTGHVCVSLSILLARMHDRHIYQARTSPKK